jgi:hypothetical protein
MSMELSTEVSTPASANPERPATTNGPASKRAIYTPFQVRVASFIGGPIAPVYTLYANFKQLNDERRARLTLLLGIAFNALLLAVLPFLPERFPRQIVPLAYAIAAGEFAKSMQLTKDQVEMSTQYRRHTGWRVAGVSVVSFIAFVIVALPLLVALHAVGVIDLG